MNIAGLVLAAGGSTRLGSPKQLLAFDGRSFLRHAAETALAAGLAPVVVVLGAEAERLRAELAGLPVEIALNPDWGEGMGSSLRVGIRAVGAEAEGVLVTLCDQPLVDAAALRELIIRFAAAGRADAIVASGYAGRAGVPAVFGKGRFAELAQVSGDQGARAILRSGAVEIVSLPAAGFDVDTPEQYRALSAEQGGDSICNRREPGDVGGES